MKITDTFIKLTNACEDIHGCSLTPEEVRWACACILRLRDIEGIYAEGDMEELTDYLSSPQEELYPTTRTP